MESIRELKKICQPESKTTRDPLYARLIIRKISIFLTWLILHTPLTANHVTFLSLVIGSVGGVCLAFRNNILPLIGIFLLQLSYVLDCVDGEVARYKKSSSLYGGYLDVLVYFIIVPVMFIGLTFRVYWSVQNVFIFALGFIILISSYLVTGVVRYLVIVSEGLKIRRRQLTTGLSCIPQTDIQNYDHQSQVKRNFMLRYLYRAKFILDCPGNINILSATILLEIVFPLKGLWNLKFDWSFFILLFYCASFLGSAVVSMIYQKDRFEKEFHILIGM